MNTWKSSLTAHKLSNLFMIVGFVIAFLALFLGISLKENENRYQKKIQSYMYRNQETFKMWGLGQMKESLDEVLNESDVNVDLFDYTIFINDAKMTRLCEVSLKRTELPVYPLDEGIWSLGSSQDLGIPTVVVGQSYIPYFIKKDGASYLMINYCEYKVIGILEGESGVLDYAVIMDYETMPEEEKHRLYQISSCGIRFGSDTVPIGDTMWKFQQECSKYDIHCEGTEETNSVAYNTAESENMIFYILIYGFALGICIICSELWIYERKTEIIICKTFGWNNNQIVEWYFKEFMRVISVGVVCAILLQWLIAMLGGQYINISLYYLLIAICMIVISSVLAFVVPMIKIQMYMPEELMTKESGVL